MSAHLDADIMLVDEVLAVGDTAFQTKCLGKLRSLADEGRTVMFVSHHLHLVADLCDRVIWLDGGRKVTDGDTAPTLDDYGRSQDAVAATNLAWVRSSLPRAVTVGSNGGDTTASTANDTTGNDTTANAANDTTDNDTVGRAVLDQGEPVVIRCVVETLQPPADALLELSIRRDGLVVTAAALKPPPEGRTRSP